jgi:hypothetical protein
LFKNEAATQTKLETKPSLHSTECTRARPSIIRAEKTRDAKTAPKNGSIKAAAPSVPGRRCFLEQCAAASLVAARLLTSLSIATGFTRLKAPAVQKRPLPLCAQPHFALR